MHILIVCLGNICRSPMAEALLREAVRQDRHLRARGITVGSAGISGWDGAPATAEAVAVLRGRGLDLSGHRGRRLTPVLVDSADLILGAEAAHRDFILARHPEAAGKLITLGEYAGLPGDVADPYGEGIAAYQACADHLAALLPGVLARLRSLA